MLTEKQQNDLHASIYEYMLSTPKFETAAKAFASDCGFPPPPPSQQPNSAIPLLEKKWVSIARLSKKVMDLEKQLAALRKPDASENNPDTNSRRLPTTVTKTLKGHRSPITSVALHPVYSQLASSSEDGSIKLWDLDSGCVEDTLKGHTNVVNYVEFNGDGTKLVSCSVDMSIKLWEKGKCVRTLRGHDHNISSVKFCGGGSSLVSVSRDKTVRFWDASTGYCQHTNPIAHSEWVRCVASNGGVDQNLVATGSNDHTICIFKLNDHDLKKTNLALTLTGHEHHIEDLAFPPSSNSDKKKLAGMDWLVSGSRDKTVKLWSASNGTLLHTFSEFQNWVRGVLIHPSLKYIIACGDDKSIRILDVENKRCLKSIEEAHGHFVSCIGMHKSLPLLVSGSADATMNVFALR